MLIFRYTIHNVYSQTTLLPKIILEDYHRLIFATSKFYKIRLLMASSGTTLFFNTYPTPYHMQ